MKQVSKTVLATLILLNFTREQRLQVTLKVLMYKELGGLVNGLLSVFSATSLYMV